jgi:RsmE family RNA methyltransferase
MPRPKVMKRLWAQLSAVGVNQIVIINAERVEKNYFDTHILKEDFYQQLLIEGLQQAGDTLLPKVAIQKSFRPYVEDILPEITEKSIRLVAFEGAAPEIRALNLKPQDEAWVAIGLEGGWNAFELDLLKKAGFTPFSMGPRIL